MRFGSHISIRAGYIGAARTAVAIGATAFQYFPKNPRSLAVKAFDRRDAQACADFCRENGLLSIGHAPYPANLAVEDGALRQATVASLRNDLDIVDACGSDGVVVHFGKFKGNDPLQGYKNIIQCLNETLTEYKGQAKLLIENQAGEHGAMGTTLDELVQIRSLCERPECIGFCLDTCHAFASGLWTGTNWHAVERRGRELGFFEHLGAVHLNDSMYPSGSGRDRHENIGKGHIGEEAFREFLRSASFGDIPGILETGSGSDGTHRDEIALVRSMSGSGRSKKETVK